jgi:hypothetical protein
MPRRTNLRIAAACAVVALGLVGSALVRRGTAGVAQRDPEREAIQDAPRERMRVARSLLQRSTEAGAE